MPSCMHKSSAVFKSLQQHVVQASAVVKAADCLFLDLKVRVKVRLDLKTSSSYLQLSQQAMHPALPLFMALSLLHSEAISCDMHMFFLI